jgi:ubiquinone/menaquinone biosynthesis C-methylase UbiE
MNFEHVSIEAVKDYWDERPCNYRHSNREVGTRAYFDEVERRKYLVEPHILDFAEFNQWQGKAVLEIGCGIGTDTMNFARAGARVTAIELSGESLALAMKRAEVYDLQDQIEFYQGNAEDLSEILPARPYDLVYSFGVIHHTPHPTQVLREVRRGFVHQGTKLKFMVYHRWSWKVLWILLTYGRGQLWKLDELAARYSEAQSGCPITYTYSRAQARKLATETGFRVLDLFVDHIFPYHIPDYMDYRYVKEWYWRYLPRPLFRAMERWLGWHLCLTAEPDKGLGADKS